MKWFKDLKIQYKLFLAFGLLVAILIFLSIFSNLQLYKVDKKYGELITSSIGRQSGISKAIVDMNRLYYINLIKGYLGTISADANEIAALHENYSKNVELLMTHLADYRSNVNADKYLTESE